jgi:hypothetical protein
MRIRLAWLLGLLGFLAADGQVTFAAGPPVARKASTPAEMQALAVKIDQLIDQRLDRTRFQPAPIADDSEFVRRIYLDLAGRIPSVQEARAFIEDKRADKRLRLIEKLLASPRYVAQFTNVWRALLIPEVGNNFQVRLQQGGFESWLKKRLASNAGYDQMVRELLTTKVNVSNPQLAILGTGGPSAVPFYLAKEFKPENISSSAARVFLGVSVECAQCHNHPFADWKREQFWSFTAFFAGINSKREMDFLMSLPEDLKKRELTIPGTTKVVKAKFLDGGEPIWNADSNTRATLADWITSPSNPYFARATANRVWAWFLGHGLVEPIDEMVGTSSTPSHPELLNLLAKEFTDHQFDLKFLIGSIVATHTYQRTSAMNHLGQEEPSMFARMPLRGLTAEQLFDSLAMATGFRDSGGGGDDLFSGLLGGARSARSEFLTKFAVAERPTEMQTSILHALTLMNGKVMASVTSLEKSETLAAVIDAPASTGDRVEALYLTALARKPSAKEIERTVKFIQDALGRSQAKDDKARRAAHNHALADVFWALLNSPEFVLNH